MPYRSSWTSTEIGTPNSHPQAMGVAIWWQSEVVYDKDSGVFVTSGGPDVSVAVGGAEVFVAVAVGVGAVTVKITDPLLLIPSSRLITNTFQSPGCTPLMSNEQLILSLAVTFTPVPGMSA